MGDGSATLHPPGRPKLTVSRPRCLAILNTAGGSASFPFMYRMRAVPIALVVALAAICLAHAMAALEWTPCSSDPSSCEVTWLRVPVDHHGAHGAVLYANSSATVPLPVYRRVATGATATTPTLVVVSDLIDKDDIFKTMTTMKRLGERASANVYIAHTRLRGWSTNQTGTTLEDAGVKPTPCGYLAIGNSAALTVTTEGTKAAGACQEWLRTKFGALGASVYSLEAAASDLAGQIKMIEETGASKVFLMAVGSASRVVETYLAMGLSTALSTPLAGVVFDTPHALHLTAASEAAAGESTSRFLDSCDSDPICRRNFDALGVSLSDVLNQLMLRLDTKKLRKSISACAQGLVNTAFDGERDLGPSHGVRRFLTAIRRQPKLARLLPVLLFRLHRCHEQDITQLDRLWRQLQAAMENGSNNNGNAADRAQTRYIEQVIAFSDVWPSEVPTWQQLAHAFETSPMGDGAMVQQQPLFCLYTGDTSPVCSGLYENATKPNASLVVTYPRSASVAATTDKSIGAGVTGDVLILASRLSTMGSDAVAAKLYDAFEDNGHASTKLLVETDSLEETELIAKTDTGASNDMFTNGGVYISQEGEVVEVEGGEGAKAALRVLEMFLGGKLRAASGKWYINDLVVDASELPATVTSTYGKAPVVVNMTMPSEDIDLWFRDDNEDPYASHLTVAVNGPGLSIWYIALFVFAGVTVLLAVGYSVRVVRRKRRYQAAQMLQMTSTPVAQDTPGGADGRCVSYERARSTSSVSMKRHDSIGE